MQGFWQQLLGQDQPPAKVARLISQSSQIQPNDMFVALPGANRHGNDFVADAVVRGASMVLTDRPVLAEVPVVLVADLPTKLPELLPLFYSDLPQVPVVAVTGTNGKTSICQYLAQLLTLLAKPALVLGTTGNGIWPELRPASHTTPDLVSLYALLAEHQGYQTVVMEASSHALVQNRLGLLPVEVAIFSNLTQDHLDYHLSMDNYFAAKAMLFQRQPVPKAVINIDDAYGRSLRAMLPAGCTVSAAGLAQADWRLQQAHYSDQGLSAQLEVSGLDHWPLQSPLLAPFNAQNLLLALAALQALGIGPEQSLPLVAQLKPALGRMQALQHPGQPLVVVDYAHTPDALSQALQAARVHCRGQLWVVFGCGGDRDRGKRPLMAQAAEQWADALVITSDNPRSEPPLQIMAEMQQGLVEPSKARLIEDRAQAIAYALHQAQPMDLVLIAGKGHEDYQEIQGQRHAFSDQQQVLAHWQGNRA